VSWKAPSLDDVTLRMTDDQIKEVLTYGRPFSPMPAWGIAGGGPMNDQQLTNLIAYLHSVAITPKAAKARAAKNAEAELAILQDPQAALTKAQAAIGEAADEQSRLAAIAESTRIQGLIASKQTASMGAALFNLNCSRCHTKGYSYGEPIEPGGGAFGPPLGNVLNQFVLEQDQIDFVTNGKKFGEKYGAQGKASGRMPYFGQVLSADQIKAIVDYERQLAQQRQQEK
jgi:mono/diheme cytochrome c family protein